MSGNQSGVQEAQQAGPAEESQQPQSQQPEPQSQPEPEMFDKDYVKKLREESAKYRTQAKENAEAAKRLAEMEEAQKTESQRQAEALESANARLAEYERKEQVAGWVAQVSKDTGVPAGVLRGSTLEEIEAHAEELKSLTIPPKGAGYVPASGTGGEQAPSVSVQTGRERARGSGTT